MLPFVGVIERKKIQVWRPDSVESEAKRQYKERMCSNGEFLKFLITIAYAETPKNHVRTKCLRGR